MGDWIWNIVFAVCTVGCTVSFFCYGNWIGRQESPVGFWANKPFDAEKIQDVSGYNREYGKVFRIFSLAPGLSGIAMLITLEFLSIVLLGLWVTVGIWWLIRSYKAIEKKYIF